MLQKYVYFVLGCAFLFCTETNAQPTKKTIANPSFELSKPAYSTLPQGWFNCGDIENTPPDVHSFRSNFFKVRHNAQDGKQFMGMIVRQDSTWESVGQMLENSLLQNKEYILKVHLARSKEYKSLAKNAKGTVNFSEAVVLRIWGGNERCQRLELLGMTPAIEHEEWKLYTFKTIPKQSNYAFLMIEAYFADDSKPSNGNLLIDNISLEEKQ